MLECNNVLPWLKFQHRVSASNRSESQPVRLIGVSLSSSLPRGRRVVVQHNNRIESLPWRKLDGMTTFSTETSSFAISSTGIPRSRCHLRPLIWRVPGVSNIFISVRNDHNSFRGILRKGCLSKLECRLQTRLIRLKVDGSFGSGNCGNSISIGGISTLASPPKTITPARSPFSARRCFVHFSRYIFEHRLPLLARMLSDWSKT